MTNEEIIEELFYLSAKDGFFNEMHDKITDIRKKHVDLSYIECVELAYIELKRKYEENEQVGQTVSGVVANNS
jgi:ribosomal protein S1